MNLMTLLTAVASLATGAAAFAAFWAAWETRKAARAALGSQLLTEYASKDMHESMRLLRDWQKGNPADFAVKYQRLRKEDNPQAILLDSCRRMVLHYLLKLVALSGAKYFDPRIIDPARGRSIAEFLKEVLVPIEKAHCEYAGGQYDDRVFQYFQHFLSSK